MFWYENDGSGEWLAVTDASRLVLVRVEGSPDAGARLWERLAAADVQGVLDELTARGLSGTPPFAVVTWDGDLDSGTATVRTIVRGDVAVRLETTAGPIEVSGRGVSTWLEQSHPGVSGIALSAESARGAGDGAGPGVRALPIAVGAVRTRTLSTSTAVRIPPLAVAPRGVPAPQATPVQEETIVAATMAGLAGTDASGSELTITDFTVTDAVPPDSGYDHLFGATMMRGVEQAAVRPAEPDDAEPGTASAAATGSGPEAGDHDGLTVMSGDIQKLRDSRRRPARPAEAAPAPTQLSLLLPNGNRELLTQPVLVGRSPSVSKVSGGQVPRLVSLGSADQDISRNHVQFQVEGDTVVVTDLHSRNGTIVVLPGKTPQKLRQGEPTAVIAGTIVDLGGGVTLTVCED
ncbi:FHA domain-containing protein [Glaciibacter sp. 2TAF33]|uniref:FHA domain-containing protein n=1 Tax=Glaciibacter sp. 2TAF33 TaxID=3233015 RepID=UPI003F9038B9